MPTLHPTVHAAKRLLRRVTSEHELVVFCDFHGHSRLKNVFMYGCVRHTKDFQAVRTASAIPQALAQLLPSFSLADTHYRLDKETAARVVAFTEFGISRAYTLECSMFGRGQSHFSTADYKAVGVAFGRACFAVLGPVQKPLETRQCHRKLHKCVASQKPAELRRASSISTWSLEMTQEKPSIGLNRTSQLAASRLRLGCVRQKGLWRSRASAELDMSALVVGASSKKAAHLNNFYA